MGRAERAKHFDGAVLTALAERPVPHAPELLPRTAMVFAAGLGTRMRPVTDRLPKPLVKVGGKPLIDHTLDRFAEAGLARAVVNVHYRADQIEAHLAERRRSGLRGPQLIMSDERSLLLDQGGGIRKALPELGPEPFFLCNTDAFWLEGPCSNLATLAARWDPELMDILLLVAATTSSVGVDWPGDFTMCPDGRLIRREERTVAPFVYTGVGIIKPDLFASAPAGVPFRLAPFFFEAAAAGRLYGQRLDGQWLHVGTPEAISEAENSIKKSVF